LRTLLTVVVVCAIPSWAIAMHVKQEMEDARRPPKFTRCFYMPPDIPIGLAAMGLQCAGLVINRASKDRKPLPYYLLAVPVPLLLGLLVTWQRYREVDQLGLAAAWTAKLQSDSWTHAYFGFAASVLVLLIGVSGLAWKKPQDCARCNSGVAAPRATKPSPFQFSLATALLVMTAVCVALSAARCFHAEIWRTSISALSLLVMTGSILAVIRGGDYGCCFSAVLSGYKSNSDNWLQQGLSELGVENVESA
jgi:hypothetical protein